MDTAQYSLAVATRVAELIEQAGLSVKSVAADAGIPRTTLQRRLRTGGFTTPELHELGKLLHHDVRDFFPAEGVLA